MVKLNGRYAFYILIPELSSMVILHKYLKFVTQILAIKHKQNSQHVHTAWAIPVAQYGSFM